MNNIIGIKYKIDNKKLTTVHIKLNWYITDNVKIITCINKVIEPKIKTNFAQVSLHHLQVSSLLYANNVLYPKKLINFNLLYIHYYF